MGERFIAWQSKIGYLKIGVHFFPKKIKIKKGKCVYTHQSNKPAALGLGSYEQTDSDSILPLSLSLTKVSQTIYPLFL